MKNTKRIMCIVLAIIMSAAVLASCGTAEDNNQTSSVTSTGTTTETTTKSYLETLPAEDYDGYEFKIIAQHFAERPNFPQEEENGEPMNDSLLKRNTTLEDRFNIKIKNIGLDNRATVYQNIQKSVQAQDGAYDMVITSSAEGINVLAPGGFLADLKSFDYLDLEADWWCKNMYQTMQFENKLFYTTGATSPFYYYSPMAMIYNKNKAKDFDIGDINQLVADGKWTADVLNDLCKNKNKDLNGDSLWTADDFYGLGHDNGVAGQGFFAAFGQSMILRDKDGSFKFNFESETAINIINKCAEILGNPLTTFNGNQPSFVASSQISTFKNGNILFLVVTMDNVINNLRDMNDDYGIIPLPKLDENQKQYYSFANPWGPNGIGVPAYCDDFTRTGLIMETMAYLSYQMVRPAMYDILLQQKIARDELSQIMLDMIYSNVLFDLNAIHNFGGSAILLRDTACGVKKDFVSQYAAIKDKSELELKNLIEAYKKLG